MLSSGKFTHLESSRTTDSVTKRSDAQEYIKISLYSAILEIRTCFSTIVPGREAHTSKDDAHPAGRMSAHRLPNNA